MSNEIVNQIRLAHASAEPKDANPAWQNCHGDCGKLLEHITLLERKLSVARNALDNIKHWKTFGAMNNGREMCSHAMEALKEIEASEIQEGE